MNYFRLGQMLGVVVAGFGLGFMFAEPQMLGGLWLAGGLAVYAACRLIPWLHGR